MALEIVFWTAVGLLAFAHLGYPLALVALRALRHLGRRAPRTRRDVPGASSGGTEAGPAADPPSVSLIIAAHDEEAVIERRVANAMALDYPRDRLEVVVASDGSGDRTVELARRAGAHLVLDLPRGGKLPAQDAAVERSVGEIVAFSDANSFWRPDALRCLVAPFTDPEVAYVCGQVRFLGADGETGEGLYWRYEMAVRELESDLGGVTAGNGAIYAVRRDAYLPLPPSRSHDLSFPFLLAKRGRRSLYAPAAVAEERMVPSLEGELARKRRMMIGLWDIVVLDGMLDPRGYRPLYAFQVASHRLLRYASPLLHIVVLGVNVALVGQAPVYAATLGAQLALLLAAALGRFVPLAPFRIARHYVGTTASIALGAWDRLRSRGRVGAWEKAEGTR